MELEFRSVELQGAHEAGGAPRGQAPPPPPPHAPDEAPPPGLFYPYF